MSENTHFFAVHGREPGELKQALVRERIPAIIDPCEYEAMGRTRFSELPEDQRWLLLLTHTDNWGRLTGLIERLAEIGDYQGQFWNVGVSWQGRELWGTFYAGHVEEESTQFTVEELEFLSRFFNKERASFEPYLTWGCAAEFCAAVGIPFIDMLDQDSTITIPKLGDPAGYVFLADEVPD
ncbi:MAG TPA: hypothetical protein VLC48_02280 [Gemmatimonadota bacterium]|nr:hypothetical protein [Gemmatimonadota bacterium]